MSNRRTRVCTYVTATESCPELTADPGGRCPLHKRPPWQRAEPYRGFTRTMRAAILRRDPACRCHGCPACSDLDPPDQTSFVPRYVCLRPSTEADHVIPHAEGGPDTLANARGICSPCHIEKSHREKVRGQVRARSRPTDRLID